MSTPTTTRRIRFRWLERARRRRREKGYTLIEVMMAVGVMTVGAVGIMSLQAAATRGNRFARQMTVATDITRSWAERLKRDAVAWNQEGLAGPTTTFLVTAPADPATATWTAPPFTEFRAHDWHGAMVEGGTADRPIAYCTEYRLRYVMGNRAIRADVRTWWHKATPALDEAASDGRILPDCGDPEDVTAELNAANPRIHAVYGSTLLRPTPIR